MPKRESRRDSIGLVRWTGHMTLSSVISHILDTAGKSSTSHLRVLLTTTEAYGERSGQETFG